MTLRELFKENPNIIINTDIDGILSGIILSHYCNCKVVGFSNSKETVWLKNGFESIFDPVYIDMFVPEPRVWCVDQHIVSVSDKHHDFFVATGTKFSPQFDEHRIFRSWDYKYKYPFGAVHYIISSLEKEGIHISFPDLHIVVDEQLGIRLGDLLLRADDAMKTTLQSNYMTNAKNWWNWLLKQSNNAKSVQLMIDFLYKDTQSSAVETIKSNTKTYFNKHFQSRSSDGGFNVITDSTNNLLPNISLYIQEISKAMSMPIMIEEKYIAHKGTYKLCYWNEHLEDEFVNRGTIDGEKVFSYAFIYSPGGRFYNFSYTVNMK